MSQFQIKYKKRDGTPAAINCDVDIYGHAAEEGLSLTQYLQKHFGHDTDSQKYGTILEQAMLAEGMFLRSDAERAIQPPRMKEVLSSTPQLANAITRNDGNDNHTPAGRMLFPEIIMQVMSKELEESHEDFLGTYDRMVAQTVNVTSPKITQPVIDTTAPKDDESMPIGQLAEPARMVSITTSDSDRRIATQSIGLQISDEALQATTLDLVSLITTAQAREERIRLVEKQLNAMINGDTDWGESALTASKAQDYDGSISSNGEITQKAWIKWLREAYRKRNIDFAIMDIDTALKIENRTNKPTVDKREDEGNKLNMTFSVENLGLIPPRVLLVDTSLIGANTVVGLDSRYAIRRVVNVSANYQAIERFVLRKGQAMRFDFGFISHKLFDDAWSEMTLTV